MNKTVNHSRVSLFLSIAIILIASACANQVAPTGGEKDVTPPILLKAIPESESINFTSREIVLVFDEFIQFRYPNDEFSIVPEPTGELKVRVKPKAIYITLPDSLLSNTTYIINFGSSVKDLNEGNPLNNLLYVFSTGSFIDSLKLDGKVIDALTGEPSQNYTVGFWLANADPSTVKPYYYTKTDEAGLFTQGYLKADTFAIYAFNDKNGNRLIDPGTEEIAFLDEVVVTSDSSAKIELRGSLSYPKDLRVIDRKKVSDGHYRYTLNYASDSTISLVSLPAIQYHLFRNRDTVDLYYQPITDTTDIVLLAQDTLIEHKIVPWRLKDSLFTPKLVAIKDPTHWEQKQQFQFSGPTPLFIDSACATLRLIPADSSQVGSTEAEQKATIQEKNIKIDLSEIPAGKYYYTLPAGCFTDMAGRTSALLNDSVQVVGGDSYGELALSIKLHPDIDRIRLFISQGKPEPAYSVQVAENLQFTRLAAGTYSLYFFVDTNNNGQWDRANFYYRNQPEKIVVFNQTLTIRQGWNTAVEIDLMELFPP